MKSKLNSSQKEKIKQYIKNGVDISSLINDYSIQGEDLTGAVIKNLYRPDEDISGVILANCIIGEAGKIVNLNRARARNCNFRGSKWYGEIWMRRADMQHSSFRDAFLPYTDFRYADMRFCDFCGSIFQVLSPLGVGVKYSDDFFKQLAEHFNLEIKRLNP